MFRMLASEPHIQCSARKQVANELLSTDNERLENTTKKLKMICHQDLVRIRDTNGTLDAKSQLHCVLALAASQIRLDASALESLNSSLKAAMNLANNTNISLELLCSRVCMRRLVCKQTQGVSKLKVVRPILQKMATSSMLYQRAEDDIMRSTYRLG